MTVSLEALIETKQNDTTQSEIRPPSSRTKHQTQWPSGWMTGGRSCRLRALGHRSSPRGHTVLGTGTPCPPPQRRYSPAVHGAPAMHRATNQSVGLEGEDRPHVARAQSCRRGGEPSHCGPRADAGPRARSVLGGGTLRAEPGPF